MKRTSTKRYRYQNEYEILRKRPNEKGMVPVRIRDKKTGKVTIKGNYLNAEIAEKFVKESPIRKAK